LIRGRRRAKEKKRKKKKKEKEEDIAGFEFIEEPNYFLTSNIP